MIPAEQYRARAAECQARAQRESDPALRVDWEIMALAYLRLAYQAERNAKTDVGVRDAAKATTPGRLTATIFASDARGHRALEDQILGHFARFRKPERI